MSAVKVASLYADLVLEDQMTPALSKAEKNLQSTGATANKTSAMVNTAMTAGAGAVVAFAGSSLKAAVEYDRNFANVRAVTGQTAEEISALKSEVNKLSRSFTATPIEASQAYYDIAGGVTDASARMPTLRAAMALSDAGAASLTTTTAGLVAAMNSYGYAGKDAMRVADIYNRTVGMGVGTNEEFVSSMSPALGLFNAAGISLEEVGAAAAWLTTKGQPASQAITNMTGSVTAFLKPNAQMSAALQAMGYDSGSAALETLGLVGTIQAMNDALGGSQDAMSAALGGTEALKAALGLLDDGYMQFKTDFEGGIEGSTLKSQAAQLDSAAAQWDLLTGKVQSYQIALGEIALPVLNEGLSAGNMLVDIAGWVLTGEPLADAVQAEIEAVQMLPSSGTVMTYTIQPGDTAQDVADAFNITKQEAQRLIDEQGGYLSVRVDPTLAEFDAMVTGGIDDALRIAEEAGFTVSPAVAVTPKMVFARADEMGIENVDIGSEIYNNIEQQLIAENNANRTVNVPVTFDTTMVQGIVAAGGGNYGDINSALQAWYDANPTSATLNAGVTVQYRVFDEGGTSYDNLQGRFDAWMATQPIEANDIPPVEVDRLAVAVSAIGLGIAQEGFGVSLSEADQVKVYEGISSAFDFLREAPISIDLKDIITFPVTGVAGLIDFEELGNQLGFQINSPETQAAQDMGYVPQTSYDNNAMANYRMNNGGANEGGYDWISGEPLEITANITPMVDEMPWFLETASAVNKEILLGVKPDMTPVVNLNNSLNEAARDRNVTVYVDLNWGQDKVMDQVQSTVGQSIRGGNGLAAYDEGGWTGTGDGAGFPAILHPQEWVVPPGGSPLMVKPSPSGLMLEGGLAPSGGNGGGGMVINGPITINGVQNVGDLFDQLQREGMRRA